jgi:hypothetical protein
MKLVLISFLIFFFQNISAKPWINLDSDDLIYEIVLIENECNIDLLQTSAYPYSLGDIQSRIQRYISISENNTCAQKLRGLNNSLKEYFKKTHIKIGYQSSTDNIFLQDRRSKYYEDSNIYLKYQKTNGSFYMNLDIKKSISNDKFFYDNSYLSYILKNQVITVGRVERWWSPSPNTSTILSNNTRPPIGISVENYLPINSNVFILNNFKNLKYTFFVNKLEKNRVVPNALSFGNRINFNLTNNLNISLVRITQFGGNNRPTDLSTIIDMLLGKDNTNRDLSFEEQAGNQIAGIDFNYNLPIDYAKSINFYGQVLGEDGLDPLNKTLDFIKFPSKRFGQIGILFNNESSNIGIEYINTYNGFKNNTYSHSLYKSGFRYYGKTFGANIDADSIMHTIFYNRFLNSGNNIQYKFSRSNINKHNNKKNFISTKELIFNEISFVYNHSFTKNIKGELIFISRDFKTEPNDSSVFMKLEYVF